MRFEVLSAKLVLAETTSKGTSSTLPPESTKDSEFSPVKTKDVRDSSHGESSEGVRTIQQEPGYYAINQLTTRPQVLNEIELIDPDGIAGTSQGKVILNLWISPAGKVVKVVSVKSDFSERETALFLKAFSELRFIPGKLGGHPVGVVMNVEATSDSAGFPER